MKQNNKKIKSDRSIQLIEFKGFSGILKIAFLGVCAVAGFGVFPGIALMYIWNLLIAANTTVPMIGLLQGLLLYGIFIMCYILCRRPKLSISCSSLNELSDEELEQILLKTKIETDKKIRMSGIDFCKSKLDEIEKLKKEESEEQDKKEV